MKHKMKAKGMMKGGMMKKKGYAKGGMKKKGYAMGGAMKKPSANQKGLKKLPTAVRNKMGYMAKGGMIEDFMVIHTSMKPESFIKKHNLSKYEYEIDESDYGDFSRINLKDTADEINKKVKKAKSDSNSIPGEIKLLENYQNSDGSISIPEALMPYMGNLTKISKV